MTQLKEILEAYRNKEREFPSYGELMALATAPTQADPIRQALEVMVERFGPCESEYIFSKRLAIRNAREALAVAPAAQKAV